MISADTKYNCVSTNNLEAGKYVISFKQVRVIEGAGDDATDIKIRTCLTTNCGDDTLLDEYKVDGEENPLTSALKFSATSNTKKVIKVVYSKFSPRERNSLGCFNIKFSMD